MGSAVTWPPLHGAVVRYTLPNCTAFLPITVICSAPLLPHRGRAVLPLGCLHVVLQIAPWLLKVSGVWRPAVIVSQQLMTPPSLPQRGEGGRPAAHLQREEDVRACMQSRND